MTTRIEKDFYFQTGVHFENKFYVNSYDLTLLGVAIDNANSIMKTYQEN